MAEGSYPVDEFAAYLLRLMKGYAHFRLGGEAAQYEMPAELHPDEARFLWAVEAGIASVDEKGRCTLPSLRRWPPKPTEPHLIAIKEGASGPVAYLAWREYLTQVVCAADLILNYGWPPAQIGVDPDDLTFDVVAYADPSPASPMVIAAEVKKTRKELLSLLGGLRTLEGTAILELKPKKSDADIKYWGLVTYRPPIFWAVSPGMKQAFDVAGTTSVSIRERADVPRFAHGAATRG
jgi:hypothetical protein